MFETIQNTYSKIQGTETLPNNIIPLKYRTTPVASNLSQQPVNQEQDQGSKSDPEVSQEVLDGLQEDIRAMHNIGLQFTVHEKTGKTMIKVMDETNSTVIREIPPKVILDLAAKIDEMLGLLFDKKV